MTIDQVYDLLIGPLPLIGYFSCLGLIFLLFFLYPRRSLRLSAQRLEAAVITCFWSVMFIYGLGALMLGWGEYWWLTAAGKSMNATVLEVLPGYSKTYPRVTYHYTVSNSAGVPQSFTRSRYVTGDIAFQARQTPTLPIIYLPEHPIISDISTNRYLLLGDRIWATVIIIFIEIGVAVVGYFSIAELWEKIRYKQ